MKKVLITGAAGFVGRYIAEHQLLQMSYRVFALARSSQNETVAERVESGIKFVNPTFTGNPNLSAIEGDITKSNCGLTTEAIDMLRQEGIDTVWHIASSTAFAQAKGMETIMANVTGTANVLSLCNIIKPKQVIFTSTAWVCGPIKGTFTEDSLPKTKIFNNPYEDSKYQAEIMLNNWATQNPDCVVQIMRPCIIVGDTKLGKTCCFTGYYFYMRAWVLLLSFMNKIRFMAPKKDNDGRINLPIKVPGSNDAPLHIIPIDIAVDQMTKLADKAIPGAYNIVPEKPETYGFWLKHGTEHIGFTGVEAGDGREHQVPKFLTPVLKRISSNITDYIPYISMPLYFSNQNTRKVLGDDYTPCPQMTPEFISTLLDYAVLQDFKE